jgi:hypothetical protein
LSTEARPDRLRHELLLYPTRDALLDTVTAFVREGRAAHEPVLVAVPQARLKLITDALGDVLPGVEFVELDRHSRNPNLVLPTVLRAFLDRHGSRPTRIVSEQLWPGRPAAEATQAIRCEAVTNWLLAGYQTALLCLYDAEALDAGLLTLAGRTYPTVVEGGQRRPCDLYAPPETVLDSLNDPVPDAAPADVDVPLAARQVAEVRDLIASYGARVGLDHQRISELLRAVDEVGAPVQRECGDAGRIRLTDDRQRLLCEIRTSALCYDPLAGLRPTVEDSPLGRGVAAANYVCDLVETHLYTRTQPESAGIHLHVCH